MHTPQSLPCLPRPAVERAVGACRRGRLRMTQSWVNLTSKRSWLETIKTHSRQNPYVSRVADHSAWPYSPKATVPFIESPFTVPLNE
jgi:hypothetical protein